MNGKLCRHCSELVDTGIKLGVSGKRASLQFGLQFRLQFGLPYNLKHCKEGRIVGQFIDPGTPNYTKMPTVRWFPRGYQYRHYYTCFERFAMTKLKMRYKRFIAVQMFLMSRKRRRGQLTSAERVRAMLRIMFCMRRFLQLKSDILKKAVFTYKPPDGDKP